MPLRLRRRSGSKTTTTTTTEPDFQATVFEWIAERVYDDIRNSAA